MNCAYYQGGPHPVPHNANQHSYFTEVNWFLITSCFKFELVLNSVTNVYAELTIGIVV